MSILAATFPLVPALVIAAFIIVMVWAIWELFLKDHK